MKNSSTQKDRILQFIDYKGISKNKFYIKTGISNGILDKSSGLSMETVEKFYKKYPEINPEWLLTGKGEMLRDIEPKEPLKEDKKGTVKSRLKEFIRYKHLTAQVFEKSINASNGYVNNISKSIGIDKIQMILKVYPELNIEWLLTGEGSMLRDEINIDSIKVGGGNINSNINNINGKNHKVNIPNNETNNIIEQQKELLLEKEKQILEKTNQINILIEQIKEKDIQISKILEIFSNK